MYTFFGVLFLLFTCFAGNSQAQEKKHASFGYNSEAGLGPEKWADEYQACAGKYQSPIDIDESLVNRVSLPPLVFTGFKEAISDLMVTNNGHTVLLQIANNSVPIAVSGGPLPGQYEFVQLHFHWGFNDSYGSEDTINNKSYPMELHMVFYRSDYGDMDSAVEYKDGLLVLAFFYEVSKKDNVVYDELIKSLTNVEWPQSSTFLENSLTLDKMLPRNKERYFTYKGSLTTPPCLEVVTWVDFKHPIYLSRRQLSTFRKLRSTDGFLTHNVRPIQPLSGRPVWYNIGENIGSSSNTIRNPVFAIFFTTVIFICNSVL